MSDNLKPKLIWSLYAASLAAVLTSFVAIVLAYFWRRSDVANAQSYDKAIKKFWRAGMGWAVGLGLIVLAAFTDTSPMGSEKPLLFNIGLLTILLTQLWFALSSLIAIFTTPKPMPPRADGMQFV